MVSSNWRALLIRSPLGTLWISRPSVTFLSAVRQGNSRSFCSLWTARFGMPRVGPPYQKISPAVRGLSPQRRFNSVLFPHPDGPTTLTISPCPRDRDMLAITSLALSVSSPNIFLRFETTNGGSVGSAIGRVAGDRLLGNTAYPECLAFLAIIAAPSRFPRPLPPSRRRNCRSLDPLESSISRCRGISASP